jgi:hypothetical protein
MSSVIGSHGDDCIVRVDADGTCSFHRDCIAYPDDESAYTGDLVWDHGKGVVSLGWSRGNGVVSWADGARVCLGDVIYEAVQRGSLRVGARGVGYLKKEQQ